MNISKALNFNCNRATLGNSYFEEADIDVSCSDPRYNITINGVTPAPPHAPSDPLILNINCFIP